MSNAFDTALINRERNRQKLAEVLESKYSAERRNQSVLRFGFAVAAIGMATIAVKNGLSAADDLSKFANIFSKKQTNSKVILDQMQKQMHDNDLLMIGAGKPFDTRPDPVRSKGEPASFEKESVPLNLTADIRSRKKLKMESSKVSRDQFVLTGGQKEKELGDLKVRRNSRTKPAEGMYRPATEVETVNNPAPKHGRKAPIPQNQYEHVNQPPTRLLEDTASYPDLLHANRSVSK